MYKSSTLFNLKWKLREHLVVLFLVILLLILTGVYLSLAPFITRPDIMGIVYVSALASTSSARLAPSINTRRRPSASNP